MSNADRNPYAYLLYLLPLPAVPFPQICQIAMMAGSSIQDDSLALVVERHCGGCARRRPTDSGTPPVRSLTDPSFVEMFTVGVTAKHHDLASNRIVGHAWVITRRRDLTVDLVPGGPVPSPHVSQGRRCFFKGGPSAE